jgi:hypothetical protein
VEEATDDFDGDHCEQGCSDGLMSKCSVNRELQGAIVFVKKKLCDEMQREGKRLKKCTFYMPILASLPSPMKKN